MAKYYEESIKYGRDFLKTTAKRIHFPNEINIKEEKRFLKNYDKIQEDLTQEWRDKSGTLVRGYDVLSNGETDALEQELIELENLRKELRETKLILERIHNKDDEIKKLNRELDRLKKIEKSLLKS